MEHMRHDNAQEEQLVFLLMLSIFGVHALKHDEKQHRSKAAFSYQRNSV